MAENKKPRITAIFIALVGLPMLWLGTELAMLGGTPYYLLASIMMILSAWWLFNGNKLGFLTYAGLVCFTLLWAIYESGFEFWSTGPKIWLVGLIGLWLCRTRIRRSLWGEDLLPLLKMKSVQATGALTLVTLVGMIINLISYEQNDIEIAKFRDSQTAADWVSYGGNKAGTRYASHDLINTENVTQLQQAWVTRTNQPGRFSGTPLQIKDGLYLCTSQNIIISLDPDTGEERWRFDPKNETPYFSLLGNCRGVTYFEVPEIPDGQLCKERIFTATTDARLIAVDMKTGQPCLDFGESGQISLLAGMGEVKPYYYFVTSPATVASGSLVVGGWVMDNQETEEPSGVVRAYDPISGTLNWAWDLGREGQTDLPPEGESYTRGTPNVWSLTSADDELGLVYVPTGNATPDYFGAHRSEAMEKYASSVVAIDAKTGLTRWHFQTTHHDIWDYDVPAQPTLVDLTLDGAEVKAVVVATKRGEFFLLNRETGEPLTEVTEKPVPKGDIAGEWYSPTQPFSTGMPSFVHPEIRESDMFGISPYDQIACRKKFLNLTYEGHLTPPSTKGTLVNPGAGGGSNWGGVAVDEERQLMALTTLQMPTVVQLIPREDDLVNSREGGEGRYYYGIGGAQRGTPYAAKVDFFMAVPPVPCINPPWGEIAVVDLTSQQIVWRRPLGTGNIGFPGAPGSFITAGGLLFNAGALDGYLRAFDLFDGSEVWSESIESASSATPMTYVSPNTGKQYILFTMEGPAKAQRDTPPDNEIQEDAQYGGYVVAYSLPE